MSEIERVISDWLNEQFNDYYIMWSKSFDRGFKIVEHAAPTINRAFYVLLCNLFPSIKNGSCGFVSGNGSLYLTFEEGDVKIEPFDNQIHHTLYVKEEPING